MVNILFAGEGVDDGSAKYLLGILKVLKASVEHVPSKRRMQTSVSRTRYDAVIFSDYPRKNLSASCEKAVSKNVMRGMGLLMIGGWGSFSAPWGLWKGSIIESLLPVKCLGHDDRVNFPSGALMLKQAPHPILDGIPVSNMPAVAGLNRFEPKSFEEVILSARKIVTKQCDTNKPSLLLEKKEYPLLVASSCSHIRSVALATDVAPHWCGGMVDWGSKRTTICITRGNCIEVGDIYVDFLTRLIRWVCKIKL